jgi:hypothetical protein
MFKSLFALVAFALLGAFVIALPAFPPKVEAAEAAVLAKGDRLQVRTPNSNCGSQVWPNSKRPVCAQRATAPGFWKPAS